MNEAQTPQPNVQGSERQVVEPSHDPRICSEEDGEPCSDCAERIEGEGITRLYECSWCGRYQSTEEIRICSGYRPRGYSDDELRDAYSHPTDAAKLESMLR